MNRGGLLVLSMRWGIPVFVLTLTMRWCSGVQRERGRAITMRFLTRR
jgi:hypothetical protein